MINYTRNIDEKKEEELIYGSFFCVIIKINGKKKERKLRKREENKIKKEQKNREKMKQLNKFVKEILCKIYSTRFIYFLGMHKVYKFLYTFFLQSKNYVKEKRKENKINSTIYILK